MVSFLFYVVGAVHAWKLCGADPAGRGAAYRWSDAAVVSRKVFRFPLRHPGNADRLVERLSFLNYILCGLTHRLILAICPKVSVAAGNSRRLSYGKRGSLYGHDLFQKHKISKGETTPNL